MFNTLAYYFGYATDEQNENQVPSASKLEDTPAEDFNITELTEEDGWGLVEKVLMQQRRNNNDDKSARLHGKNLPPSPPPSPPSECSWIVTPPPCFNAEIDKLVAESFEQYERENLMIEHPSIFVPNLVQSQHEEMIQDENEAPPTSEVVVASTRVPGSAKRSQRRASRQVLKNKAQQKKRCVQKPLKQKSQNRNFNKMRLIVQQPRKHY